MNETTFNPQLWEHWALVVMLAAAIVLLAIGVIRNPN